MIAGEFLNKITYCDIHPANMEPSLKNLMVLIYIYKQKWKLPNNWEGLPYLWRTSRGT
jgi:hypothetical protein